MITGVKNNYCRKLKVDAEPIKAPETTKKRS